MGCLMDIICCSLPIVGIYTPLTLFNKKSILWAFVSSTILGDNMDMATGDSILFSFNLLADTTIVVSWV